MDPEFIQKFHRRADNEGMKRTNAPSSVHHGLLATFLDASWNLVVTFGAMGWPRTENLWLEQGLLSSKWFGKPGKPGAPRSPQEPLGSSWPLRQEEPGEPGEARGSQEQPGGAGSSQEELPGTPLAPWNSLETGSSWLFLAGAPSDAWLLLALLARVVQVLH